METLAADLATDAGVEIVEARIGADPQVNIIVNNAGSGLHEPSVTTNLAPHLHGVDLMVKAPMRLAAAAGLVMEQRGSGIIINVGSVAGMIAMNNYSAIKAWMNTFSDALALELRGTGVQVMTLLPGWVRTEFHSRAKVNASAIPWLWLSADGRRRYAESCGEGEEQGGALEAVQTAGAPRFLCPPPRGRVGDGADKEGPR